MIITIEVASEAGGMLTTKRGVIHSEEFESQEEVEAAAVDFIRKAKEVNDAALGVGLSLP